MSELKPCPFCGGEAKIIYPANTLKPTIIHANKKACYANGWRVYDTEAEAIEAWNTRAEIRYEDAMILLDELGAKVEQTCRNVDEEYPYFECSECGCHAVVGYRGSGTGLPNYCPNCGAKVVSE